MGVVDRFRTLTSLTLWEGAFTLDGFELRTQAEFALIGRGFSE